MSQKSRPEKSRSNNDETLLRKILDNKYHELSLTRQELQKKDGAIVQKNALAEQHVAIMAAQDAEIKRYEKLVEFMRTSKFWKVRNAYFRFGLNKFYPTHMLRSAKSKLKNQPAIIDATGIIEVDEVKISHKKVAPLVSIIVPNYNHEKFLTERLQSIYAQTYKNYEVILLDDNSSDGSINILEKFAKKYKALTRLIANKQNSGNVFTQWQRGIGQAKGDLIWVAESDDFCDKDFLEKLVPQFSDESVMLAYAFPQFVGTDGNPIEFAFENYVADLSTTKWQKSYVETAHNEVNQALGIKNTIPNVSGVVFRNIPASEFDYSTLKNYKVCADWYFYLSIIRGGRLAFVKETTNYYRFHTNNTSSNYQKDIGFVKEYASVARHIAANYKVTKQVLTKNREAVQAVWDAQNPGREHEFPAAYNSASVVREQKKRQPNILMGTYAFTTGGGETVPIRLGNALKEHNYAVTLFDFLNTNPEVATTRGLVQKSVPVLKNNKLDLNKIIDEFGIEIMHSHHTSVDVYFAGRTKESVPHVVTTHGLYETLSKTAAKSLSAHLKKVNYWVYTADKNLRTLKTYDWFASKPLKKLMNAAAPLTHAKKPETRGALGISDDDFVLCLVSRAIVDKGWYEAIDAVTIANSLCSRKIQLLLIGDGPLYDQLKTQDVDKNIHLLGFRENLSDYFELADVGVLPSTFAGESFPLVLLECLTVHRPFIGTNVGEIEPMLTLEDGTVGGKVLKLKDGIIDVYEFAEEIVAMAEDKTYYQACVNAALKLSKRYHMEPIIAQYDEIYKACLERKRKPEKA